MYGEKGIRFNATKSYALAYDKDLSKKKDNAVADTNGPRLLGNARIKEYMRTLLTEEGFTPEGMDRRLMAIIDGSGVEPQHRLKGIDMANELMGRKKKEDSNPTIIFQYPEWAMPTNPPQGSK